ncbi:MAG: zinc-ribbon domain-containing protein [Phycisphaerales bacterium]|nr:zinc-ribbon domain-containing protein [Phycisphaerales bacterium]
MELSPMGLRRCKDCGHQVSSRAVACPQCGAPSKAKTSPLAGAVTFLIIVAVCAGICTQGFKFGGGGSSSSSTPKTPEERRKEQIERHISAWDGSHCGVTEYIKKSMHDPDSYAHDETRFLDKGDHLIVYTKFRGKNAFGGVVRNSIIAKVDLNGNVLEIISQGP